MFFDVCEHVVSSDYFPEVIMKLYLIRMNRALARLVTQNGKVQIQVLKPPRCNDEQRQRAHEAFRALMTEGQQGAGDRRLIQPAPRDCRCTIMWLEADFGLYFLYCEDSSLNIQFIPLCARLCTFYCAGYHPLLLRRSPQPWHTNDSTDRAAWHAQGAEVIS